MLKKPDNIPQTAGVYRFLDGQGRVLYVGKARNLAVRLSYYLSGNVLLDKTARLVREAEKLEWTKTSSEIESLVLEADLIKKFRPRYNVSLKDDKSYSYVLFSKISRRTPEGHYSAVTLERRKIPALGRYFGPFPNGYSIKMMLKSLRRHFPYRDCRPAKFFRYQKLNHGCLFEDLKLCPAPCVVGSISPPEYQKNINILKMFFEGRDQKYIEILTERMNSEAAKLNFEKASEYKAQIGRIAAITSLRFSSRDYLENPNLYEDIREGELKDLEELLKPFFPNLRLTGGGRRIEAFDISNLGSSGFVGALVTFKDGELDKSCYRRYKIKETSKINDVGMMAEVVGRRLKNKGLALPDLILIDGGKSQLSKVSKLLDPLKVSYVGLAKKFERVVVGGRYLRLPKNRPFLRLLMRIRDETHRFAIAYQRRLRRLI